MDKKISVTKHYKNLVKQDCQHIDDTNNDIIEEPFIINQSDIEKDSETDTPQSEVIPPVTNEKVNLSNHRSLFQESNAQIDPKAQN